MKQRHDKYPIDYVATVVQRVIQQEKFIGIFLGLSVVIAMFLANSPWQEQYFAFFKQKLGFIFNGRVYLEYDLLHWINDGLMAIFFFVVGLELKKEFISGDLASPRQAILPVTAALGGMLVPALIYILFNFHSDTFRGWGIPMATDIAFALGALHLLGKRVPVSFKVFLAALAIVDDLGAVLVIAAFYTSEISLASLIIGLGFAFIMFIGNRLGVRNIVFYAIMGVGGMWVAFLLSGVHATIAAVLAAFTIPARVRIKEKSYVDNMHRYLSGFENSKINDRAHILKQKHLLALQQIKQDTNAAMPPLQRLEHAIKPYVNFIILPIFALANAGLSFGDISWSSLFSNNVAVGVGLGLLAGKVIGITFFTMLLIKLKICSYVDGMNFKSLIGLSLLASIGFTMSIFITTLAFDNDLYIAQAKSGIFIASIVGGTLGYLVLRNTTAIKKITGCIFPGQG